MTRYELLDRIGVGGMAEIFRGKAVAAGGFEKPVAIKRILPHLAQDKRFVELLIAEAKVLSLLKHRNIVQIFDVGLGDDGKYFLVMEYVDGKDLGAIQRGLEARRRRIAYDLVLHLCAEICEALEHAHSARAPDGKSMSLVHRDVSPSNVLLSRAGEIKLTDFGIAKRAESEATGHGAVRGKFAYISPEQARNEHIDPRSDVFSVGILLWELLTNRRLFSGLGDIEALRAVREAQVPRPRELDGRLSQEVDALVMSTLSRESRNRPTAGQLGAKLRSLRYALDVTVGDPASELAKIIDTAEDVERVSAPKITPRAPSLEFDASEATVIRIHTADEFSRRNDGAGVARAREVIDRFEEEETRQAQLSRDQIAFLRATAIRDSGELASAAEPPLPGVSTRASDEMTRARPPLSPEAAPTFLPDTPEGAPTFLPDTLEPTSPFEADEATRLVPPPIRRTPPPERLPPQRLPTKPPPMHVTPGPKRTAAPGLAHTTPPPGTVHDRGGRSVPPIALPPEPPEAHLFPVPAPVHAPVIQAPSPQAMLLQPPHALGLAAAPAPLPPPPAMPGPPPALHAPTPAMPAPLPPPPAMPAAGPPPLLAPQMPPGYQDWAMPAQPGSGGGASPGQLRQRPMVHRTRHPAAQRLGKVRAPPLRPWMLVIGALIMALLAFTVTRACIHSATRPAAEAR